MRAVRNLAPVLAGAVLALAAWHCLSSALPSVPNRHAFNWDSARRAMLNVGAADALRAHDFGRFLVAVGGPETWPTLRLTLAAPLHALAGPARALGVEHSLSLAFTAALFLFLGLAARQLAPAPTTALLILAVSAAALLGARALYVHAANGMLEVPSALLTLAAVTAWLASREGSDERPWSVALLGNLLFHVRWQHGLLFAASVLLTEVGLRGGAACARSVVAALVRGAKTGLGMALLVTFSLQAAVCCWVWATSGGEVALFGLAVSVRSVDGPLAFAALALFGFVEFALFHDRRRLAAHVTARVRFLWAWLLTPMAVWLLMPFTWRLRTLARISAYDMAPPPEGLLGRLWFYPEAAWDTWSPSGVRWLLAALLLGTLFACWRSPARRRQLLPLFVFCALEFTALELLSRRNYQSRFLLNLVPLVAVGAAGWIPSIPRALPRTVLALAAASVLAVLAAPAWREQPLAATLSEGFADTETGDACRAVAEALPVSEAVLLNQTSLTHRQACTMWVTFLARERGAHVTVPGVLPRGQWREALVLAEGCAALAPPEGLVAEGSAVQAGPLCGQRYRPPAP